MPRWNSDKHSIALVIDDEQDIVTIIQKALENKGDKVIGFSDPTIAMQYFEKNGDKIDLVITDARMPEMSGFEVARKVKQMRPDVKVVLISAFEINKPEFDKVMPKTKIDDFLEKPFHISQLLQVVDGL